MFMLFMIFNKMTKQLSAMERIEQDFGKGIVETIRDRGEYL